MPETPPPAFDSRTTIAALAALASILGNVLHEGLGHGLTAWVSGAHQITLSTVALQSDIDTRWISAAGTLANLVAALVFWLLLRRTGYRPVTRYFLVLAMAGNLFAGTGYFFFSGISNFGDWADVIKGLQPHWAWRLGLFLLGVASYYAAMLVVAAELRAFTTDAAPRRMRGLCWLPYFVDGLLALVAGILNPAGIFYVIASALPSTLGANAGLLSLPTIMRHWRATEPAVEPLPRSMSWIATAVVAGFIFVFVIRPRPDLAPVSRF